MAGANDLSEYGERSGRSERSVRIWRAKWQERECVATEGFCVRRFDRFLLVRLDTPYQDKQGHWKQAWRYCPKGNGHRVCAITDMKMCGQKECKRCQKTGRGVDTAKEKCEISR